MVRRPASSTSSTMSNDSFTRGRLLRSEAIDLNLLSDLHKLHADEFAYLSQNLSNFQKRSEESWVFRSFAMIRQYILFLMETWLKAAWACVFYPTTFMDRIAVVALSFAACVIMSILLPWCLVCNIPIVGELFDQLSRKVCNGLSIVNASYPTIFEELTYKEIEAAREHLSKPIKESGNQNGKRIFNLDAAKLLLQCAALMYERTGRSTHKAASAVLSHSKNSSLRSNAIDTSRPGAHILALCGALGAELVTAELHDSNHEEATIKRIANDRLGLRYLTVSDMNSFGSSYCGLFWDPEDTFIIASFRGTNPTDFTEWNTDFTFQMREAGSWLRGFGKVHNGFMKKVFPTKIPAGSRMPYATIVESIKLVAETLKQRSPGKPINVWITGHSLGCALASLVYARMIFEPNELGENVIIRDSYIFAAPILCDVESANAFNNRMNHRQDQPRTMWRITNANDFVATGLPEGGDNTDWSLSPWNLFSFAHLGCEVKLRNAPIPCMVKGNLITPGTQVLIDSAFHLDALEDRETPLRMTLAMLQRLPLIGCLMAHGTGFYWAALQGVGTGSCDWLYE